VADVGALEAFLHRLVATGSPPGLSVAVVTDGRVAYDRAFGTADGPRGRAATPETVDHWWSMTKIPTAIATLQPAARGALRLDAPVADLRPWFAVRSPAPPGRPVTVRHRLTHSWGVPDPTPAMLGWVHHDADARDQTALARQRLPRSARLRFAPGSRAVYSNLNSMVLGAAIEAASGEPYARDVVERVLRPLGMGRTDVAYTPALATHEAAGSLPVVHRSTPLLPLLLDGRALVRERRGRLLWRRRVYPDATPPSGLIGPAPDAARLLLAYLGGGQLDGARVRPPEGGRAMPDDGGVGGRGPGWAVRRAHGRLHLQHSGGGPGFATSMRRSPEERLGVVVLANGTDLDADGRADLVASVAW
jgi:CubicO group peptidase (beta-lactamase class C family)